MAAIFCCWDIMIMFPLICSYDSFGVCWSSLNMLTNIASGISAFVVAPVDRYVHTSEQFPSH